MHLATKSKRETEKSVLQLMVAIYCRGKHGENRLCQQCSSLLEYAEKRVDRCPFMETKTFCSNCKVHCYRGNMRKKIREVMRYAGPRMMLYHPVMAFRHLIESRREKQCR